MKKKDIDKYADRINFECCDHKYGRNLYFLGYVGIKGCKAAMCVDCNGIQFIGNNFFKKLYPAVKKITRNRFEVLDTVQMDILPEDKEITIEPDFKKSFINTCVLCGRELPLEYSKQYCKICEERYISSPWKEEGFYGYETKSEK